MLATIVSAALQGIDAALVHVEINTGESGEPDLMIVGPISPKWLANSRNGLLVSSL